VRVLEPMPFDFVDLADAVVRSNVGVAAIRIQVDVRRDGDWLRIQLTDQGFRWEGDAPMDGWTTLEVLHWDDPAQTVLRTLP
jgi:hypothetical protein